MGSSAILAFGYDRINVLVGERGVNDTLRIKGSGESEYEGYNKGRWNAPDELGFAISHALRLAESASGEKIERLFVGVPDCFAFNINKNVGISFASNQIITEQHIESLKNQGNNFNIDNHVITDINPIYYNLDDERRVLNPLGEVCSRLSGELSYILVSEAFFKPLLEVFNNLEVQYRFSVHILAKTQYFFSENELDPCAVIIDIAQNNISVALAKGRGLLSFFHFALGAKSITDKLEQEFEISKAVALSLKKRAMLSLIHTDSEEYELVCREGAIKFGAKKVNEVIIDRICTLSFNIAKCLSAFEYEFPNHLKYYLLGEDILGVRGATDVISKQLRHTVCAVKPRQFVPQYPQGMDLFALLNSALKFEEQSREGQSKKALAAQLKNRFFKN